MDLLPPKPGSKGIRSGPSFVQPAQARDYARYLRSLADQWDAAADPCERLRAAESAPKPTAPAHP